MLRRNEVRGNREQQISSSSTHPTATSTDENLKKGFRPGFEFGRASLKVTMEGEGDSVMEKLATDDIIDIVKGRVEDNFEEEDEDDDEEVETGATFGLFGDPSKEEEEEEEEDLNAKYNHVSQSKADPNHSSQDQSPGASNYHQESYAPPQTANPYQQVGNFVKRL